MSNKADQIVKARYLGDTPVVFPHLAETDFRSKEFDAWVAKGGEGINPRCVIEHGDIFPVDRVSAEGREDLEITSDVTKKES